MPWSQEEIDAWKARLVVSEHQAGKVDDYASADQQEYASPKRNTNGYGRNFNKQNTPSSSSSNDEWLGGSPNGKKKTWKPKTMKQSVPEPGVH